MATSKSVESVSESPETLFVLDRLDLVLDEFFFLSCFFGESDNLLLRLIVTLLLHRVASSSDALLFFFLFDSKLSSSLDDALNLDFLFSLIAVGTVAATFLERWSLSEPLEACDLESLSSSLVATVAFEMGCFFLPDVVIVLVRLRDLLFLGFSFEVRCPRLGLLIDFLGRPGRFLVSAAFGFSAWIRLFSTN